jgi:hypothetical protein
MPRGSAPGERRGGRKKGTKNRKTVENEQAMEEARIIIEQSIPGAFEGDAHALMMAIYKHPEVNLETRLRAASVAVNFEKARLASMEVTGKDGGPVQTESADIRSLARVVVSILSEAKIEETK